MADLDFDHVENSDTRHENAPITNVIIIRCDNHEIWHHQVMQTVVLYQEGHLHNAILRIFRSPFDKDDENDCIR